MSRDLGNDACYNMATLLDPLAFWDETTSGQTVTVSKRQTQAYEMQKGSHRSAFQHDVPFKRTTVEASSQLTLKVYPLTGALCLFVYFEGQRAITIVG